MSFFERYRVSDINAGVEEFRNTPDSVLLDVRTEEEYILGHIPDSLLLPLGDLADTVEAEIPEKSTPVFVHCRTGGRSAQAAEILRELGYTKVADLGGVNKYKGRLMHSNVLP